MPEVFEDVGSPAGTSAVHNRNTAAAVPQSPAADAPGGDRAVVEYAGARLEPKIVQGRIRKAASSTSPEKARLRENSSRGWTAA